MIEDIDDDDESMSSDQDEDLGKDLSKAKYRKRVKKGISKKQYEPIIDGNMVYRFEDNPSLYMKTRK